MTLAARPTIPAERFEARLSGASQAAAAAGIDALLIGVGADLRYLSGYDAHESERLTLLVVPARGAPTLVVPLLEKPAALAGSRIPIRIETWTETENPAQVVARPIGDVAGPRAGSASGSSPGPGPGPRHRSSPA